MKFEFLLASPAFTWNIISHGTSPVNVKRAAHLIPETNVHGIALPFVGHRRSFPSILAFASFGMDWFNVGKAGIAIDVVGIAEGN
jgi:hypothetical protein